MSRSVRLRLADIADSIAGINAVTAGITFEAYDTTWAVQRAVERGLEIISEASRHIPDRLKAETDHVPWRQIAAIGNVLRHDYQRIENRIVWNIITEHLPVLKAAITHLLQELDRQGER